MSISFSTIVQKARPGPNAATTSALNGVLAKIAPTTYSHLSNGFKVACEENPNAKFATVGLWLDAGSRYEKLGFTEGSAKMLELAGLRATTNLSRPQIVRALDEIGGHLHVETQPEHKFLYVKCAKENVQKAVTLLADIANNARLADEDLDAARKELSKQRRAVEENPDKLIFQNLHVCAYDSTDSGLGLTPVSNETAVRGLNAATLSKFRAENHTGPRMALVGAGAVSHTQLDNLAKELFNGLPNTPKPQQEMRFIGGDYRLWNLRYKTTHIAWAFETCGATSGDIVPLTLATHIHGGFHRSQHELGQHAMHRVLKVYSSMDHGTPTITHFAESAIEIAQSFIKTYSDTGLCGMHLVGRQAVSQPGGSADAMHAILQYTMFDWVRMSQRSIHQQELEQAKVNYKAQLLFNMDGATNTVEDMGKQVLHLGRRVPISEMYARIDDVTPANVTETLQHYYFARKPVFSMTGYLYILPGYDWLTQMTYKQLSMH